MNVIYIYYKMSNKNSLDNIIKLYDNLTYFDKYIGSIILLIIKLIILGLVISYCYIQINIEPIRDNWNNEKCKPHIMPFAGLIYEQNDKTTSEFTIDNFNNCVQDIIETTTGAAVSPLSFATSFLQNILDGINKTINGFRDMISNIRKTFEKISVDILSRIMNIMIPLQMIIIAFKDIMAKVQGVMTGSFYTLIGSYYTLKSLMGAIVQFIITILIGLAIIIAVLWIVPFTWGAAAANTAIFVAISIPMAIILTFMTQVLNVKTNLKIPKIKCFDKYTKIKLKNDCYKIIKNIKIGDILDDDSVVTGIMKLDYDGSIMYNLNNVIVSDSHMVKYNNNWVRVCDHPKSFKISNYKEPYIYCFNTNTKTININDITFTDWDEIYDNKIKILMDKCKYIDDVQNIHKYLDGGFYSYTLIELNDGTKKNIKNIQVGDVLKNNIKVYGVVQIKTDTMYIHSFKDCNIIGSNNLIVNNESTININKKIYTNYIDNTLYHLLTDKDYFFIDNLVFSDYNACIDNFIKIES